MVGNGCKTFIDKLRGRCLTYGIHSATGGGEHMPSLLANQYNKVKAREIAPNVRLGMLLALLGAATISRRRATLLRHFPT